MQPPRPTDDCDIIQMDSTVQLIEDLTDVALGRHSDIPARIIDQFEAERHLTAAEENSDVDVLPVPAGRGKATKKIIIKGGGFVLSRQRAYNRAVLALVRQALDEGTTLTANVQQERRRAASEAAAMEAALRDAEIAQHRQLDDMRAWSHEQHAESRRLSHDLEDRIEAIAKEQSESRNLLDAMRAELILERHRRGVLERELRALRQDLRQSSPTLTTDSVSEPQAENINLSELYERFEQFFRPTGDDLTNRFSDYLPDLEYLRDGDRLLLDIGTGRGDFLNVLGAAGIRARGIDSNTSAVAEAIAGGLDVIQADAMEYLKGEANESLGAVTAFHVVEHLAAPDLVSLVDEIVRVLAPGGTVILETPNPTNLVVGASSFYHDPTHHRPVTPDYLAFLLRDRGLVDVQTRFLHPLPEFDLPIELAGSSNDGTVGMLLKDVQWALKGPQDYAVVARSPGDA